MVAVPAASDELYSPVAPSSSLTSNWSWNCARLVKELGKGFYGDVYLAEEVSGRLVAVKKRNRCIKYYRATIQLVQNLLLTSKEKFRLGLVRPGQN